MKKNSDLHKEIRRRMDQRILVFLIVGFRCVTIALLVDILKKLGIITNEPTETFRLVSVVKQGLMNDMDKYCNLVMTLNTILAAAVIFFYSVQDSRKGGIPHRTILAYTLGAFTVPVLFVTTLLMLPFCYISESLNLNWTVCISLLLTYIIQIMIVVFILTSTSYQYSVYAITNVEIRQYRAMCNQETEMAENTLDENCSRKKVEQNPFFTWTYLQHHLEQITVSDELVADKLLVARRILRVPYYEKEILLREEVLRSFRMYGQKLQMSADKLENNNIRKIYEFYYGNLLAVFNQIRNPVDSEYRDKVYLILYEFMEELTELYEEKEREEESNSPQNYLMTVAGIINAVLSSGIREAEAFCNYVFNNIISKDVWDKQIGLYIIYRKYLYAKELNLINTTKIDLSHIVGIDKWKSNLAKNIGIYILFWEIWMEFTTVAPENSYNYLYEALKVLGGDRTGTDPITYTFWLLNYQGKGEYDESKSNTDDK